jgi:hypothetical protein
MPETATETVRLPYAAAETALDALQNCGGHGDVEHLIKEARAAVDATENQVAPLIHEMLRDRLAIALHTTTGHAGQEAA